MAMTGLIILLGTLILGIWQVDLGTKEDGIINVAWEVLLRAMSPDQLATNQKWPARIILLVITLVGLLLVSTLISILNSVIERRMEFLHRGRGEVHLSNHKVVLS
jgi:steroid 5-alpha reductase family enzyme